MIDRFLAHYPFTLDRFQLEAIEAIAAGRHVVVAAPTGSGKTVVAEYALDACLERGERAFYTTPIKALSNQKYRDLAALHGGDRVGLLTGDVSIQPDAPLVVMTTEVLRNMIYARSPALRDLSVVVVDEVHYLQDSYRGPVWEEVMIHLPEHVRLVCLSATVSNAGELAEWLTSVRGATDAITETTRPVELVNHYLVADRAKRGLQLLPVFVDGGVNRDAERLDDGFRQGGPRHGGPRHGGRRRLATPRRTDAVRLLARRAMLPAIYFIFSRAQCDEAAAQCADAGIELTTPEERLAIEEIAGRRLATLDDDDLDALGVEGFVRRLAAGIAAHHAGMVPAMKEVVEECFAMGLVKIVFATETLAVGINMPARAVVIEKLTKFNGETHEQLTASEFTQLTGRAGRRGIDDVGHAIVCWSPWVRFDEVASLAASRSFRLRSAFRPTFNMAANLIARYSDDEAHRLLNLSFAQFQADRRIVELESKLRKTQERLAGARDGLESPFGDLEEYRRLRAAERTAAADARRADRDALHAQLRSLRPGTVVEIAAGAHRGPAAVISNANRNSGVRLRLVAASGAPVTLDEQQLDDPPPVLGSIALPNAYAPNRKSFRNDVGRRIKRAKLRKPSQRLHRPDGRRPRDMPTSAGHPVERDPDLRSRLERAANAERLERSALDLEAKIAAAGDSLSAAFERVIDVLAELGYADRETWSLSDDGERLARIFHESDLLVAEMLRHGVLDDLAPADLAAVLSTVVYEHRSPDPPAAPWFSSKAVRKRAQRTRELSNDLERIEQRHGIAPHRPPDPTFAAVAHGWVLGEGLAVMLDEEDFSAGDFVRTMKQLVDLLRQVAIVAPHEATRAAAAEAADVARRGVVAESAVAVGADP